MQFLLQIQWPECRKGKVGLKAFVIFLLLSGVGFSPSGWGGENCALLAVKKFYRDTRQKCINTIVKDYTGELLPLFSLKTGQPVGEVKLLQEIGKGCRGNVYRYSGQEGAEGQVLKLTRIYRIPVSKGRAAVLEDGLESESVVLKGIQKRLAQIERAPSFPKDPSWESGRVPVVPILEEYDSPYGRVLVKPEVTGVRGALDFRLTDQGNLPGPLEKALREIYDFHRAIEESVPAFENGKLQVGLSGLYADIGATNLFWVENPELLKKFGMKRPGLMLYELDRSSALEGSKFNSNFNSYPTWESYRDNLVKTLRYNSK